MALGKYFRAAFVNPWNLLVFCGACAFALLSGFPDVVLPLVLAGEVGYLGFVGTHPKFQKFVDIQAAGAAQGAQSQTAAQAMSRIMGALPLAAKNRFDQLRQRCLDLRQIATDLKQSGMDETAPLDSLQKAGLDRLLWIFLRLLFAQYSISRFLEHTHREEIAAELKQVDARIAALPQDEKLPLTEKSRRTLIDHRQTCQERLDNFDKAQGNHELVGLELDRLENKIASLAELAVNRQEPDFIAGQVDQVATSMRETERTMNELDFATGLGPLDEQVPELLPPIRAH
ncbi:MAG TPA: hypothetical protein VFE24_06050 [Pirellulales bacterium]|jgi:phage terminase Nu1 subunit (DNA packaging protein)|nr:hypothetical protein [Pirellulales bacterium]